MMFSTTFAPQGQALAKVAHRMAAAVSAGLATFMEQQSRSAEIARLRALDDAELAALGVPRDRIVYHVFRDRFWV
jgi:hypothetical protein